MSRTITWSRAASLLIGSAVVVMLACPPASAQREEALDASYRAAGYLDAHFLVGMIDDHGMAIAMMALCETRAVHPQLTALCDQMADGLDADIVQMQDWLDQWYATAHEPEMSEDGRQHLEALEATSGAEFEVMFLELMIAHHQEALKRVVPCAGHAEHEQLSDLCARSSDAQGQLVAQLTDWLCEWYGICDGLTPVESATWSTVKALHR